MLKRAPQCLPRLDTFRHLRHVERELRDQDDVSPAGDPGVQRDPAGVTAHHFDHHDPVVRLGGGVQAIDRVGGEGYGGIEPEGVRGFDDVVVDRFRNAHQRNAAKVELVRDRQGAIAADHDQRIERELVEHLHTAQRVVADSAGCFNRVGERVAAVRGSEDRSADAKDAGDVARCELAPAVRLDQAVEAVLEADDFAVTIAGRLDNGADDGVQARGVAAAGEHADSLDPRAPCRGRRHPASIAARPRGPAASGTDRSLQRKERAMGPLGMTAAAQQGGELVAAVQREDP